MKSIRMIGGAVALLLLRSPAATAQSLTPHAAAGTTETTRRQAQQVDEALTRASSAAPVLSGGEASAHATLVFPAESPCFHISQLEWKNAEAFAWLVRAVQVQDVCVGSEGITRLRDHLRYLLIERGYVTTQVLIGQQDLRAGKLEIELVPGRIGSIAETGDAPGRRQMAMPMAEGDVLNLRDLDQTLENIRTVAGDASVRMVMEPGKEFGQTDLAIHHAPAVRRWRAVVTADNSGIDATGKNQLGGVLVVDSPLGLYDQLIATYNNDAHLRNHTVGSRAMGLQWTVPYGYGSFWLGANQYDFLQTIATTAGNLPYTGRTRTFEVGASHVAYRTGTMKGTVRAKLSRRSDDVRLGEWPIGVQTRDITSYTLSYAHYQRARRMTFTGGLSLRGSIPAWSANSGYVSGRTQWNGRYSILSANAGVDVPFSVGRQRLGYRASMNAQAAPNAIPATEMLSIGSRYSVRGFDGSRTLVGQSGWVLRNEVALAIGNTGQEAYAAADAGAVGGSVTRELAGRTLVGAALGIRGAYGKVGYDVSVGMPVAKPAGFEAARVTVAVQLSMKL
ncbi:ShlB/FhaC/HecB family hemolysin secretion/activation protein [Cupriavidus sp. PET2-C1]